MASSLKGDHIFLRDIQLADVTFAYQRWMTDPEIIQYLESRFHPPSGEELKRYVEANIADPDSFLFAICDKTSNRHIGNIKLGPINRLHKRASIGIVIGEKECFGKGFGPESVKLVVAFAFNDLNLHKLTAGCYAPNINAEKVFTNNGFKREGTRRQHSLYDGKYVDVIELGLINPRRRCDG
ncbi:MAG: GNAT family protein [Desulfobacterales bacterium]|jgi:RimJ/RimL family protein N-acetyltransferase|nr:GNAT family protein [Desulfobacterales bacterium]MDP6808715.1 GNAT family protein [Desulfobacterales bacterium]|tara:strand:+ start:2778 stop:3323 length:546 start_codon:yes stop_codon:yes gene_type:complete